MPTATTSVQRQAAEALVRILEVPGLAEANWTVHPKAHGARLIGQLGTGMTMDKARAAIAAYAFEIGLDADPDLYCPGKTSGDDFTTVSASGEYRGVRVRVWAPAISGGVR